ncbi:PPP1R14C: Protein phosphatase 1 regulatory inhibitor subunit 14C, partial [Crotalus adamanteus]
EEEMPDVEIDIDDLLDAANEEERALKLQVSLILSDLGEYLALIRIVCLLEYPVKEALVDCYKPTEDFIKELLTRIRGMRKLSPPQKKSI